MKIYSEVTKKFYNTVEECEKAEEEVKIATEKKAAEAKKLATERKAAADIVEDLFKAYVQARENYEHGLRDFCNKYGAYHKTVKGEDMDASLKTLKSLSELIDLLI